MKQTRKCAVFDIDGTLYRWQLFHELVHELTLGDILPENTYRTVDDAWNDWRGGTISFHAYEMLVVETLMNNLPQIPIATFDTACDKVVAQSGHKVHSYPRHLMHQLREKGYTIIALSGSQQEILERFCKPYGFDIVVGSLYERRDGQFTGNIQRQVVGHKAKLFTDIVAQHNLSLTDSIGIGDSDGDISLLEAVEQPIAFNPSEGLFVHAKAHGWQIVIERKNIAYRMEKQHDTLILAETIVY